MTQHKTTKDLIKMTSITKDIEHIETLNTLPEEEKCQAMQTVKTTFQDEKRTKKEIAKAFGRANPDVPYRTEKTKMIFDNSERSVSTYQRQKEEVSKPVRASDIKLSVEDRHVLLSKSERVACALQWLHDTFPNLFKEQGQLPMKIGTTHDISDWIDGCKNTHHSEGDTHTEANATSEIPSKTAIRDAIRMYTNTPQYQKALQDNDKRYDVNGVEFGVVEEQQKEHAEHRRTSREAGTHAQAAKHKALTERRKRIAATWHLENQAKKKAKEMARESVG